MMCFVLRVSCFIFLMVCFLENAVWARRIYIVIDDAKIKKTYLSIPEFKSLKGRDFNIGEQLRDIIQKDLLFSDIFEFIDSKTLEIESYELKDILFKEWAQLGTEFLVAAGYEIKDDELTLDIRVFDIKTTKIILAKKYMSNKKDLRSLAHRFSDDVFSELTGEKGIFQTKILFVSDKTKYKELYVMDYDGQNIQQLTTHKSIVLSPAWAPDGKTVSYSTYVKDKKHIKNLNLFALDLFSGKQKTLSNRNGLNNGASWSSKGKNIALTMSFEGNPEIYLIDENGENEKRLTDHGALDVEPSFSPDGKYLVFSSGRSPLAHLYTLNLKSNEIMRLTHAGQFNAAPSWSIKDKIAFASQLESHFDIFILNSNGLGLQRLTQSLGKKNNEHPSWSANGRHIVFSSNRSGKYGLYVMNEDGSNEKPLLESFGNATVAAWSPFME